MTFFEPHEFPTPRTQQSGAVIHGIGQMILNHQDNETPMVELGATQAELEGGVVDLAGTWHVSSDVTDSFPDTQSHHFRGGASFSMQRIQQPDGTPDVSTRMRFRKGDQAIELEDNTNIFVIADSKSLSNILDSLVVAVPIVRANR